MKKLITLFLVLAGMVGTVSAENVTRRIFVITDAGFQAFKGDGLAVHAWYTDNSGDLFYQGNEMEKMATIADFNPSNAKGLWMKDLTFDGSKEIKFFVYKYGDTGWHSSDATQQTLSSSSGMTRYSWNSTNNGDLSNDGPVTYSAYLYDGVSTWTQQPLTCNDYYTYTTTIDNQTSYNNALEVIIAPSIAFLDDLSGAKWDLMYRPNSENQYVNFSNQSYYGGGCWAGNSNSLKLNAAAYYNLTFYPYGWNYSVAPYITRTVTTANVATFSFTHNVAIPSGLTASYVTGVGDNNVLNTANFSSGIPGGTGALLIPNSSLLEETTYSFYPTNSTDAVSDNKLVAATTSTNVTWNQDGKYNYILTTKTVNGSGATPKFYLVNNTSGNTVSAGRAWLQLDAAVQAREYFSLWEEPTAIENMHQDTTVDQTVFDLQGRRVQQPTKGLYIVNGKKVIK